MTELPPGDDQEPFPNLTPFEEEMERMNRIVQSWVNPEGNED